MRIDTIRKRMETSEIYKIFLQHPPGDNRQPRLPRRFNLLRFERQSFDGNKFAEMAIDKGCSYAVVDEAEYAKAGDERFILVDDCLKALQQQRQLPSPPVGYQNYRHHWHQRQDHNQRIGVHSTV